MSKASNDPRRYLREAEVLAERVLAHPHDEDAAIKLAVKVGALSEAIQHGSFKLVRR